VGTYGGGISRFDGNTWTTFTTTDGLLTDKITGVAQAPNGDLWCSHPWPDGGISRYDGETWTVYPATEIGLGSENVFSIAVASDGTVWVGGGGVSRFNGETWTHYTTELGMDDPAIVEAIAPAPDGTLWVGGNGISHYDGETWTHYSLEDIGVTEVGEYGVMSLAVGPDNDCGRELIIRVFSASMEKIGSIIQKMTVLRNVL
jgi:ligand-binding sensor domain-containing protein